MSARDGHELDPLFHPRVVAVAGMSNSKPTTANRFVRDLRAFGFTGPIYAIHPSESSIDDVPAVPRFADLPETADYAYIAVPARHVPGLIADADGRVRFAQVISSGFGELPGEDGARLQTDMLQAARSAGVRVLGPNCLGSYAPSGRLTFVAGAPADPGNVAVISQSGGLAVDFILRGANRGLRFSSVVTVGNSADVDATELLAHHLQDPTTAVVGMYLETTERGRDLFDLLKQARGIKPVVLLKGGSSAQGSRAAASHTGALASDDRVWVALCRQTATVLTETLDEFLDALLVLRHHPAPPAEGLSNVSLVGNGGGTSVLASDALDRVGLVVPPLSPQSVDALDALGLPPGTSVVNPVDTPAGTVAVEEGRVMGRVLEIAATDAATDAVIVHFNLAVLVTMTSEPHRLLENLCVALRQTRRALPPSKPLLVVLRSDGNPDVDERRRELAQQLSADRIPVLSELVEAAGVLGRLRTRSEALLATT